VKDPLTQADESDNVSSGLACPAGGDGLFYPHPRRRGQSSWAGWSGAAVRHFPSQGW